MATSSYKGLGANDFDEYNGNTQAAALKAIKSSVVALPQDLAFHRSLDARYAASVDMCSDRVLGLINKMLGLATSVDAAKSKAKLESQEDLVDRFKAVAVDAMDRMLERTVSNH
jgi:exosome complex exonuclease RRP6